MVEAGMPAMIAEIIVEIFGDLRAGSMAGTTDAVHALTGQQPPTFARFARDHAALFSSDALFSESSS